MVNYCVVCKPGLERKDSINYRKIRHNRDTFSEWATLAKLTNRESVDDAKNFFPQKNFSICVGHLEGTARILINKKRDVATTADRLADAQIQIEALKLKVLNLSNRVFSPTNVVQNEKAMQFYCGTSPLIFKILSKQIKYKFRKTKIDSGNQNSNILTFE